MNRHWFTADTHFSHRNIIPYCNRIDFLSKEEKKWYEKGMPMRNRDNPDGWRPSDETVANMDTTIINLINKHVEEKDTLWHLGDFCFPSSRKKAQEFRNKIKCKTVNFIWGNHDQKTIQSAFNNNYERYRLKYEDHQIILSHYAQAVWQNSHHGAWMLYGHSHSTAEEWLDRVMPGRKSIDVGIDNAKIVLGEYRPFSFEELKNIFKQREGCSIDHHVNSKKGQDNG